MPYNIDPKLWGKYFWGVAHYITISYPNNPSTEDKLHVKQFFDLLTFLLPCENCRNHYINNLKINPLSDEILNSKYRLIEWLVSLHNEVNGRTGKKLFTVEDAIKKYTRQDQNDDTTNYTALITIILLVVLICVLIYYTKFCN